MCLKKVLCNVSCHKTTANKQNHKKLLVYCKQQKLRNNPISFTIVRTVFIHIGPDRLESIIYDITEKKIDNPHNIIDLGLIILRQLKEIRKGSNINS